MDDSSRQINRQNRRKAALKRKWKKEIAFISIMVVLVIALIIGVFIVVNQSGNRQEITQIQGTWQYDEYIKYEFDGEGSGCMCLEDLHYEYKYTVDNNELILDFKDESVHDCTYTFLIDGNALMLTGGEGTIGGTYELKKQN